MLKTEKKAWKVKRLRRQTQERASCWVLYYFTKSMQTEALWVSSWLLSSFNCCMTKMIFHRNAVWPFHESRLPASEHGFLWCQLVPEFIYGVFLSGGFIGGLVFLQWDVSDVETAELIINGCFSPSLFRALGLPPAPSCAPCRVWKPSRDQLHRAAECAGSAPTGPHTP